MSNKSNKLADGIGVLVQGGTASIENVNIYQLATSPRKHISQNSIYDSDAENSINDPPPWIKHQLQANFSTVFVERSQELEEMVDSLLIREEEQSINITALWGAAGSGKTALALLICCIPEVITYFRGEVFWVDIKEGEDIIEGMRKLYRQSMGSEPPNTIDEILTTFLQEWTDEPKLIVLDNLQTEVQLRYFLSCRNNHCTWLITTRNKDSFAKEDSVKTIQINPLQINESALLLYYKIDKKINIDFDKLKELVSQLYEFPLLIDLVRKEINRRINALGYTPNNAISSITEELQEDGWNFCEDIANQILARFRNSIEKLKKEERECLEALIIFPEDIDIPISVLSKLWNLSKTNARRLCEHLYCLSFLQKYDSNRKIVRMNNILREFFLQDLEIKEMRPLIHTELLAAYEKYYKVRLEFNDITNTLKNIPYEDYEENIYFRGFCQYHLEQSLKAA
jgi:hypothetical protein